MATFTDQYILEAEGSGDLQKIDAAMKELYRSFHMGKVAADEYVAGMNRLVSAHNALSASGSQAATATQTVSASIAGIQRSGSQGAMGLLLLSQAIDDAQYGFRAIVNNIPMLGATLGQSLGMGTESALKLGGALGILAVAINTNLQRINEWKALGTDILGGMGFGPEDVQSVTDKLWGMADALKAIVERASGGKLSFSVEGLQLQEKVKAEQEKTAKAGEQGYERAGDILGEQEQDRAQAFRKAVEQSGGGEAVRDRAFRERQRARGLSDKDLDEKSVTMPGGKSVTMRDFLQQQVGNEFNAATKGRGGAGIMENMGPEFREKYEANRKDAREEKKRKDEDEEDLRQARIMEARKQDEANRQRDQLNLEGQANEQAMRDQQEREARGYAGNLQSRYNRGRIMGRESSEYDVAKQLEQSQGLSAGDARRMAGGVLKALQQGFTSNLEKKAGEHGTTTGDELTKLKIGMVREDRMAQLGIADARLGVVAANMNLRDKMLGGAPERVGVSDFARQAEAKGGSFQKDMLEKAQAQLAVQRAQIELQQRIATAVERGQTARFGP